MANLLKRHEFWLGMFIGCSSAAGLSISTDEFFVLWGT